MLLMDFDTGAIRLARSFWPQREAEALATLLETEQYELSQESSVLRYDLFHSSLSMEMVYDMDRGVLKISYEVNPRLEGQDRTFQARSGWTA